MRFLINEHELGCGSAKALSVSDHNKRTYWIPRSQISVVETIEKENDYDTTKHIIEVKDWVINKNNIPIFKLTEMQLIR